MPEFGVSLHIQKRETFIQIFNYSKTPVDSVQLHAVSFAAANFLNDNYVIRMKSSKNVAAASAACR